MENDNKPNYDQDHRNFQGEPETTDFEKSKLNNDPQLYSDTNDNEEFRNNAPNRHTEEEPNINYPSHYDKDREETDTDLEDETDLKNQDDLEDIDREEDDMEDETDGDDDLDDDSYSEEREKRYPDENRTDYNSGSIL